MSADTGKQQAMRVQPPTMQKQLKAFRDLMFEILELKYDDRSSVPILLAKEALNVLVEVNPGTAAFPTALKPFRELLDRMLRELPPPGKTTLTMQEMHKHFQRQHRETMKRIAAQSVPNGDAMHVGQDTVEDEESAEEQEEDSDESEEEEEEEEEDRDAHQDTHTEVPGHGRKKSDESTTSSSKVCGQPRPTGRLKIKMSVRETELQLKRTEGESIHARLERRREDLKGIEFADDWVRIPVKRMERHGYEKKS